MAKEEKSKHTFFLRAGDVEYLSHLLRPKGISVSQVLRKIVSNYVDELQKRERRLDSLNLKDISDD